MEPSDRVWVDALARYNSSHVIQPKTEQELGVFMRVLSDIVADEDVNRQFKEIFEKRHEDKLEHDQTLAQIPRFYFKKPDTDDALQQGLWREARTRFLHQRGQQLLDNSELDRLYSLLVQRGELADPLDSETDGWIDFEAFCNVGKDMGPKCAHFFTSSVFLKFGRDVHGRIPWLAFFNFVMRKLSLYQTRISLSFYDAEGFGNLREQDLENYIFELMPTLPALSELKEDFYPFYVFTAVRKFFFFLDPGRRGRIPIKDLLVSPILAELFELREENTSEEMEESNWFSAPSVLRVYGHYLDLDLDENGMLSSEELKGYGGGSLSEAITTRIFEVVKTYDGEMDFKTYLDFVLAMENKKTEQAQKYFFRLLDIREDGYLTAFVVNYFFRDIRARMRDAGHEPARVEDVKDEIFDMVKPVDPLRITIKDLLDSECGDTIISILIDINGFWAYDNREIIASEEAEV